MHESKDPAIKLFGQKIPLPGDGEAPAIAGDHVDSPVEVDMEREDEEEGESDNFDVEERNPDEEKDEAEKDSEAGKVPESSKERDADPPPNTEENTKNTDSFPEASESPKTPSIDEETAKSKSAKSDKDQNDAPNSQEKTLKKPDKMLPCPRCNSMDTKFCYYNNYNVNQPRYFCKACQRYWTAGGTMRNVPVGAGRRKNKNSGSHYRHITISEALQAARIDIPNGTHLPTFKSNGRVLSFGLESPICDSIASVLNLAEKKALNGTGNGFHSNQDQRISVPCRGGKNGDECSTSPSITVSNAMEENGKTTTSQEASVRNNNGFAPQIPCLPGIPWPYPWNSPVPSPALCPPGFHFPLSFYPAPYWNGGVPGNWNNIPWFSSHPSAPSPNPPTLGKHSRDGELLKTEHLQKESETPKQKNGSVLVPKTLRIDDPNEAAKSSIWATLGITNEAASKGGMFKGFQPKKDEKKHIEASPVLRANPAALSRSINFHENS